MKGTSLKAQVSLNLAEDGFMDSGNLEGPHSSTWKGLFDHNAPLCTSARPFTLDFRRTSLCC